MSACMRVRWTTSEGAERVGVPLRVIPPGEVPTVPGVAKHRQRFVPEARDVVRMLVCVTTDGIGDRYYAPHVGSLEEALDETREEQGR